MNKNIRSLSLGLVWFSLSTAGAQEPASTSGSQAASRSKPAAVRSLDEIRTGLEKKKAESQAMAGGSGTGMGMGVGIGVAGDASNSGENGDPFAAPASGMSGMGEGAGMGGGGMAPGMLGGMPAGMSGGMGMPGPSEKQLIGMLIQQLRSRLGSKDYKREKVEKQLRAALEQYFLLDMEERVREFDKVKARVAEMEAKLERRLESETDIIDLQIKQMMHKADGLDFTIPGNFGYGMGMGMGMMGSMGGGMGMDGGMMGMEGGMMGGGMLGIPGIPEDLSRRGYDAMFGLTRIHRSDSQELDSDDPLLNYADTDVTVVSDSSNESAKQKMKTLLLALHQFDDRFKHFPKSANRILQRHPPHSWRVAILPLIGEGELYKQYQFDQPWDSEQNRRVAAAMPEIYRISSEAQKEKTSFKMIAGEGTVGSDRVPTQLVDITDGTSNTIALVVSNTEVPWTKPEDVTYSAGAAFPELTGSRLVGMADGSVRTLGNITPTDLRALITRAGGESVNTKDLMAPEKR